MLLADWLHAGPFRVVIRHPHLLHRGQINYADFVVARGESASLHVVLDVFRKPGKKELKVGGIRRLHRDRLPTRFSLRTFIASKQPHLFWLETDKVRSDQL